MQRCLRKDRAPPSPGDSSIDVQPGVRLDTPQPCRAYTCELSMEPYNLTVLPFSAVISDQSAYNSQAHTAEDISTAVSKSLVRLPPDVVYAWPPPEPYAYGLYANLVAESQRIPPDKRLDLAMPSFIARELLTLQASFLATNHVSDTRVAEVAEDWQDSRTCRSTFGSAFADGAKWFVRLDDASPKDSPTRMPVTSAKQLVRMLATSMRARAEVERKLEDGREIIVFLRLWDGAMGSGIEFRCFIPPLAVHAARSRPDGKAEMKNWTLSAMSQYTWHRPFPPASTTKSFARDIVETALNGAKCCTAEVLNTAREVGALDELKKWGFVMDVVVKLQGSGYDVQLVEVNPFGAVSGCGSCLFHWLRDAEQLHGLKDQIEVRIAIDGQGEAAI